MAWYPIRSSRGGSESRTGGPVFGIGRQAFVNAQTAPERRVSLLDEAGSSVLGTLPDCEEVEIVAWMPRGASTRYHVRSTKNGVEGWVRSVDLRATRQPLPPGTAAGKTAPVSIPPRMPVAASVRSAPARPAEGVSAGTPKAVGRKRREPAGKATTRASSAGTTRRS